MDEDRDERFRRHDVTDEEWARREPLLPAYPRQGHRWSDHRMVINGVFHRVRAGDPWCDLPERFGPWQTVYNRRWSGDGTWEQILAVLQVGCDEADGEDWTVALDSTMVRAHQHAAGARHAPPGDIDPDRLGPSPVHAASLPGGDIESRSRRARAQTRASWVLSAGSVAPPVRSIGRVWVAHGED